MIVTTCPHCSAELAGNVKPHCDGKTCGWVVCRKCDSRINKRGAHCCGPILPCIIPERRPK